MEETSDSGDGGEKMQKLSYSNALKYFASGALARIFAATLMSPVDTVKTRLQFQGASLSVRQYRSAFNAFRLILREEGALGFFRGLPPRLLYITPAAAVSFLLYEQFSFLVRRRLDGSASEGDNSSGFFEHPLIPLLAGGVARVFGTATRTPFDILRQRLQVSGSLPQYSHYRNLGMWSAMRVLIEREGLRGMLTGYLASILRDVPFASIYFFTFEFSKQMQSVVLYGGPRHEYHRLRAYNHFLAGAAAATMAATLTIPMDVVKTRLQTQATLPESERRYCGIGHVFVTIYREEGIRGLSRGLGPRLLYLIPASSITFTAYEFFKRNVFGV